MESKNLYVPDHKKWLQYFQNVLQNENQSSHSYNNKKNQNSTSDGKSPNLYIIPIEEREKKHIPDQRETNIGKVTLISPIQQTVEQAESELKRSKMQGKKRKNIKRLDSKRSRPPKKQHTKKRSKKREKSKKSVNKRIKLEENIFV
ncbi:hypothetical protein ACF0H5_008147 [Mactra antiquata]